MVKEFNSKKGFKKLKTIKKVKLYPKKKYRKKTKKIKLSQKKNLTTNISINDEMQKNFFDAQSSIKINCYVCNKSLVNQIKIILDPSYSKNKNFQKGLNFNALCVKCFVFKTKFNPKDMTNYVINEMSIIKCVKYVIIF